MAARAEVEPTTLRLKAIDSTKAPPCPTILMIKTLEYPAVEEEEEEEEGETGNPLFEIVGFVDVGLSFCLLLAFTDIVPVYFCVFPERLYISQMPSFRQPPQIVLLCKSAEVAAVLGFALSNLHLSCVLSGSIFPI